jgi:hypothetical protein
MAPGSVVASSNHVEILDAQNQTLKTEQELRPGMAVAHAHIISEK